MNVAVMESYQTITPKTKKTYSTTLTAWSKETEVHRCRRFLPPHEGQERVNVCYTLAHISFVPLC